ncbi:hypothetical protein [Lysobacter gummosus]|uniref:Uncharacterized protein n=1 Tax=Lysobacter gummosus TaxID=262324 RepID=A0ABY3XI33_9GAMM|nr:hypothetical protein [Lysobacter gummosus]ALN90812.1 hypothetical protein LG3211_1841 [Lysobacter gummosus]UNP31271.1 hypothetical protein MOV92_08550 [Lysobacter gummosus]
MRIRKRMAVFWLGMYVFGALVAAIVASLTSKINPAATIFTLALLQLNE